jgi:hypothetical protein
LLFSTAQALKVSKYHDAVYFRRNLAATLPWGTKRTFHVHSRKIISLEPHMKLERLVNEEIFYQNMCFLHATATTTKKFLEIRQIFVTSLKKRQITEEPIMVKI